MFNRLVGRLHLGLKLPCLLQNFLFTKCEILVEESRFEEGVKGVTFKRISLEGVFLIQLN